MMWVFEDRSGRRVQHPTQRAQQLLRRILAQGLKRDINRSEIDTLIPTANGRVLFFREDSICSEIPQNLANIVIELPTATTGTFWISSTTCESALDIYYGEQHVSG